MNVEQPVSDSQAQRRRIRRLLAGCGLLGALQVCFPWPFWRDAVDGGFHLITPLGLSGYVISLGCTGAIAWGLVRSRTSSSPPRWVISVAAALVAIPALKWAVVGYAGLDLFHNRWGLGQEILGPIPNVVIDAVLGVGSLLLLERLWRFPSVPV